jgi:ornithine cyclodeaminase
VFVEYTPQTRIEGDIQRLSADFPVTELWQVLSGAQAGRRDAREVTVFDSVGFAMEDFSALRFMQAAAAELQMGEQLNLIPQLADPKDLFGMLVRPPLGTKRGEPCHTGPVSFPDQRFRQFQ